MLPVELKEARRVFTFVFPLATFLFLTVPVMWFPPLGVCVRFFKLFFVKFFVQN